MHILHAVQLYYPVASGAGRYFHEIGTRLAAEGHRVTVLATDAHDLEHLWLPGRRHLPAGNQRHEGVDIVRLPVRRLPGALTYPVLRRLMAELSRLPGTAALLRRLATLTPRLPDLPAMLARSGPFDLIHATNISLDFSILPLAAWARTSRTPVICTPFVHLGEANDRRIVRYYSMRHQIALLESCQRVLTMTGLERDFLVQQGVPAERIQRVGVGVTPAEVQGGDGAGFRAEHHIAGPLVLCIGAMARDKGTIDVVEAMRRLWQQGSASTLVLIGAPLAHFQSYYDALPDDVRARIRMLAYAPETAKRDALAAADVFVLPSRTDSFGIVYLEAWCNRVPVIGARAGGVPDVITDGETGLLVPYGAPPALADALGTVLGDTALRTRMGNAGYARVMAHYTWDAIYRRVRGIYAELGIGTP